MIEKLIQFAMTNRLLTAAAIFGVACMGVWSMLNISVDSFPDVSNIQVQVITEPESMATEEVEKLITFPIETGMNGLPNITKIRSNSSFGLSVVTVIFEDSTDVYWARNVVNERLGTIELPAGAPRPVLGPVVSTFSNVYDYYMVSDRHDFTELRTIQDWQVARRLRSVHGVGNVVSYGGFVKQYQVFVSPQALKSYGLSLKEVNNSLATNNVNAGGNFIVQGGEEVIIRGLGLIEGVSDIENIVLKQVDGVPVKVGKVARVEIGPAFRRGSASMNGKGEVITGMVLTRKGVNTKAVVEEVRRQIDLIRPDLPEGVTLHAYYDQTELVDKTIETVKEILLFSGGLVIVVLFAVLLHIPSALIVSVIIPLSLLFSFVLMKFTGLSANLMTLGAVDFGVVVDAGVVMVENIFRHLSEASAGGKPIKDRWNLVLNAAQEVGRPIVFAIAIIIAVYLPLFTLEGVEGKMFIPLALTFIYALVGALLCALLLIPILCFWFMRGNIIEKHSPVVVVFKKFCNPALYLALKYPRNTIFICCASLVGACCLIPFLGSEFIPTLDEGSILLRTKQAPSVSHVESQRINTIVEQSMIKFPEVECVVTKIGRSGMGGDLEGVDNADIYIGLKPKGEWKTTQNKEELVNRMAKELDEIPGLMYSFSQPIADMIDDLIAGIKADLGIKIFGEDLETVDRIASEIEAIVNDVRGSADVQREHVLGLPQLNIKLNRDVIARHGLNVADIQDIIQTALAGKIVTEVLEGTKRFGLLVRFPYQLRDTVSDIESIPVETVDGARIPLKSLAQITKPRGTVMINREDGQRRTAVLANVRGRDLGGFVQECQSRINAKVKIPKGYYIVYGGQFENQQRAMQKLAVVVPVVLLLIFVLLFASFNSLKNAGLIMLNVPFAMIGGIVALFLSRQPLSVPAIIGFIALFGVAVQNGVIMVSYIMQLQQRGLRVKHAAIEGAKVRLRPVAMTAMVAIMGLLPKIFSSGTGAEVQRPLATVVLGGLVTATALTLIVVPTIYCLLNKDEDPFGEGED
ncbi:MAG: CusA/CzcA family heavy metal efflux RND transporter [Candidatus Melainabacteria bacterium]|nr:CusA/CzcA family heavy metal efflux RND transporter [Candidatus Melainabacteria bacterium]